MRLFVTRRAIRHIGAIAAHVRKENPKAALNIELAIRNAFTLITEHPDAGRSIRLGLRRLPVPRLPYLIYYSVEPANDRIEIITVRHAARGKQPS